MKGTYKFIFATLMLFLAAGAAQAQTGSSPYSKFGYGLLGDNATGAQRAMGSVGYALQNPRQINVMNPASYSQVDSLTFLWDIGIDLTNLWKSEEGNSGYDFGGGLDYINAQFRISKKLGGSFGLVPYSSVGYSFGNTLDSDRGIAESRSGSGSINELYAGVGYEVFKNLSLGVNFSYMFGNNTNATYISYTSTALYERVMEVRDWNFKVGLQYKLPINKRDNIVIGATYSPKMSFHGHTWGEYYDVSQDSELDTIGYTSLSGKYQRPHSIGLGVSYNHNEQLTAELDFTYQNWKDAKYTPLEGFEPTDMKFDNRWKVAAGMQYTPNRRGSYAKSIFYRLGAFYNHDYVNIGGNNVRDYGVTAGIGLPAPNSKTIINFGLEWKHRYSSPTQLIKEDYLNITLSVNFNELWFWKNKIR